MLEGINRKEYDDYLKYYSNINTSVVKIKNLPDAANEYDKVINVNLNLFLRMLGASNEIIEDDYKTLQFMFYVKFTMDEARAMRNIIDKEPDSYN
jgi:hypothetical protein